MMPPRSGMRQWSKALAKVKVKKRPTSSVELMSPGSRPRILSRGPDGEGERSWLQRGVGADAPDWASHCVHALMPRFQALKIRMGSRFRLVCWSDCGGLGVELIAIKLLAARLEELLQMSMEIRPYAFCDSSAPAQKFATLNHKPGHIINDIMERDFEAGTFRCQSCGVNHDLPSSGIDLYVCGFPCGPWSARGKQLRFGDADGDKCWQALKSIKYMKPCLFALENVMRLDSKAEGNDETDLDKIVRAMKDELADAYTIVITSGLEPCKAGYPVRRQRVLMMGARADQVIESSLRDCTQTLMNNSMHVSMHVYNNYRQLLGLEHTDHTIPWTHMWRLPSADDTRSLMASRCTCTIDPYATCEVHPCKCGNCREDDKACKWRVLHKDFISSKLCKEFTEAAELTYDGLIAEYSAKLSYVAMIELSGKRGPTSPRERNLLNILSLMPKMFPMALTPNLVDKSQGIFRGGLRHDGAMGTLASTSEMWSFPDGRLLSTSEVATLMGHDTSSMEVDGISDRQFRQLLGLSIHVGTAGMMAAVLLASLGCNGL